MWNIIGPIIGNIVDRDWGLLPLLLVIGIVATVLATVAQKQVGPFRPFPLPQTQQTEVKQPCSEYERSTQIIKSAQAE